MPSSANSAGKKIEPPPSGNENVKAWVTKYALTEGIIAVIGEVDHDVSSNMLCYQMKGGYTQYAHGNDWHRTPEDALKRAEEMRKSKLAALQKQTARIVNMTFEVPLHDD